MSQSTTSRLEYSPDELAELARTSDPLIVSLQRDGITFFGVDLDAVLHLGVG